MHCLRLRLQQNFTLTDIIKTIFIQNILVPWFKISKSSLSHFMSNKKKRKALLKTNTFHRTGKNFKY